MILCNNIPSVSILVFVLMATAMGLLASMLSMPSLIGEIVAGFLLGLPLAGFVPYPEVLVLVGEIGLIMLLLETGVELDVAQLCKTGLRAFTMGAMGTVLPLALGVGLGVASSKAIGYKSALVAGASFSPTTLGVAASALKVRDMVVPSPSFSHASDS